MNVMLAMISPLDAEISTLFSAHLNFTERLTLPLRNCSSSTCVGSVGVCDVRSTSDSSVLPSIALLLFS